MLQITVNCSRCGKLFIRSISRYNEAVKFGWKQYCSHPCQSKAKVTAKVCICFRKGCGKIDKFRVAYCSRRCAALVSNLPRIKIRTCLACGKRIYR